MSNEHVRRIMNIVQTLDSLRNQLMLHICRLTAQAAEAYPDVEGLVLESIIESIVSSSSRMTTDILTSRYRLLKSFTEENPDLSLSQAEADSTSSISNIRANPLR
jgi:hypothetical protein